MSIVGTRSEHEDLVEELLARVETYNPGVDKELIRKAFEYAELHHRGQVRRSGEEFIRHPWGVARICAELHLDEQTLAAALLHDVVEDTGADPEEIARRVRDRHRRARRGRHQAHPDPVLEPRAGGGRELPQDDRGDGQGRSGHPDQARRPAPQHADDRVSRPAEAGAEGEGDTRGLRAARPPARDPRGQVGARGPVVPDPASAQVLGDQGDGRRPPRRPRGAGRPGEHDSLARARQGRHPVGHLGPREALLFDLRQDGQEGPRVQRDLRPHRDEGDRRALGR